MTTRPYTGRFAPTPTGPLHFGSLLAAVASHCDARAANGRWLLRMEDIDPPREMPGAADTILHQLEAYGLHWDGPVLYQSQRSAAYLAAIDALAARGQVFWCHCSRSMLAGQAHYPGTCREYQKPQPDAAVRLRVHPGVLHFTDRVFGAQQEDLAQTLGDFVIRRRDGLFAYQLAVVVDDAFQGITDVVRGADLLDNTARQLYLQAQLGLPALRYAHLPLVTNAVGEKLSKQNLATPLPLTRPEALLWDAIHTLGQAIPHDLQGAPVSEQLRWAVDHWDMELVPKQKLLAADPRFTDGVEG
jgi:glutamyl-Q tRNA(Asp) synthetase